MLLFQRNPPGRSKMNRQIDGQRRKVRSSLTVRSYRTIRSTHTIRSTRSVRCFLRTARSSLVYPAKDVDQLGLLKQSGLIEQLGLLEQLAN